MCWVALCRPKQSFLLLGLLASLWPASWTSSWGTWPSSTRMCITSGWMVIWWVRGVPEGVLAGGVLKQPGTTAVMLQSNTMDHYGNFHVLEHLLHAPPKLRHQLIFQILPSTGTVHLEELCLWSGLHVGGAGQESVQGYQERPGWHRNQNRHHPQELLETVWRL